MGIAIDEAGRQGMNYQYSCLREIKLHMLQELYCIMTDEAKWSYNT